MIAQGRAAVTAASSRAVGENPEMQKIRDALGVIAVASPACYRLCRVGFATWCVISGGTGASISFGSRDEALQSIRLAVVRCRAYCLSLEEEDGQVRRETYNWPAIGADELPD
jgi:hypothetical protein